MYLAVASMLLVCDLCDLCVTADLFAEAAKGDQGAEGDEKDTAEIGGDAQATEAQPAVEANVPVAPRPWLVFPRSYTPADYERAEQAWTDGFPESGVCVCVRF